MCYIQRTEESSNVICNLKLLKNLLAPLRTVIFGLSEVAVSNQPRQEREMMRKVFWGTIYVEVGEKRIMISSVKNGDNDGEEEMYRTNVKQLSNKTGK